MTRDPQLACVGEQVTVDCTLNVPGMNDMFLSVITNYIVGSSDNSISAGFINGSTTLGGVDLSKLIAFTTIGTSTTVPGRIVLLSYLPEDNNTRLGCAIQYQINGGSIAILRETTNIIQACKYLYCIPLAKC